MNIMGLKMTLCWDVSNAAIIRHWGAAMAVGRPRQDSEGEGGASAVTMTVKAMVNVTANVMV